MSLLISQRLLASSTQMLGVPPPPCDVENVNMANSLKPFPPPRRQSSDRTAEGSVAIAQPASICFAVCRWC